MSNKTFSITRGEIMIVRVISAIKRILGSREYLNRSHFRIFTYTSLPTTCYRPEFREKIIKKSEFSGFLWPRGPRNSFILVLDDFEKNFDEIWDEIEMNLMKLRRIRDEFKTKLRRILDEFDEIWDKFGTNLKQIWDEFLTNLMKFETIWDKLETNWRRIGDDLETYWRRIGDELEMNLKKLETN